MNGILNQIIPLFAQALPPAAEVAVRDTYRFARLQSLMDERWMVAVLVTVCFVVAALVAWLYRRDTIELRPGRSFVLLLLRIGALAAVVFFFLDLEKRTEREVTYNSRVLLLVDTSMSMSEHDSDSSPVPATPSRIDQVVGALKDGKLIDALRDVHDVTVVRFDADSSPVASLKKKPERIIGATAGQEGKAAAAPTGPELAVDWQQALVPRGTETRLGDALKRLIESERSTPVSAVVVLTDGAHNAGIDPGSAAQIANSAEIPVFTIGLGSNRRAAGVRVSDFLAPARAYPNDAFSVTGYIQSQELAGRRVTVELFSRDGLDADGAGILEDSQRVMLGANGEVVPVKFELSGEQPGRRTLRLKVEHLPEDTNAADNQIEVDVEVVDRQTRLLLMASAATREYRFLRNQLRRDQDMVVDVLLQSSPPGISQDANSILDDFPSTKEDLYQYDAIIAFDADWNQLSGEQLDLLEKWVGEQAGGLIAIAGPIHTDAWVRNPSMAVVRNLYPVEFQRRFSLLADADYGSTTSWPIEFTREGNEAEFLWIDDTAISSQTAWAAFPGVYGYYSVRGPKPGATVYARYSDPEAAVGGELPVYMAGHFYGAGRVFYLGSGEMWRLRSQDEAYFEEFYTKLIRHVSQARLLRGSMSGVLLVEHDRYLLGSTVVVRAQLSDAQHEPLDVPSVALQVTQPDSTTRLVMLQPDPARKGNYSGQFTVLQEGAFRLDLPVPETIDDQLTRRIRVSVPDLERENPQRNDAVLSQIATSTGGLYYVGLDAALGENSIKPLVGQLRNRKETTTLSGTPDKEFSRNLMQWLLGVICGCLCLEWLIRRLSKLA